MEITSTTLILVGLVCVVLGFVASLLLGTLRDDVDSPAQEEGTPPGGRKNRYSPVARLWRERGENSLVIEMDGRSFATSGSLDAAQRERLEQAARDLRAWLGMGLATSDTAYPGTTSVVQAVPPAAPVPAGAQPVYSQAPVRPVPAAPPVTAAKPEEAKADVKRSMVMQIEDILQDMIAGTPLGQRGVHLIEDPVRGVLVQVGLDFYEGIESVPDAEIKNTIRSAVQTWESNQ